MAMRISAKTEYACIAMLELGREKLIEITQTEAFQPIYVRVHQGGTEPGQESA